MCTICGRAKTANGHKWRRELEKSLLHIWQCRNANKPQHWWRTLNIFSNETSNGKIMMARPESEQDFTTRPRGRININSSTSSPDTVLIYLSSKLDKYGWSDRSRSRVGCEDEPIEPVIDHLSPYWGCKVHFVSSCIALSTIDLLIINNVCICVVLV